MYVFFYAKMKLLKYGNNAFKVNYNLCMCFSSYSVNG